MLRCLTLCAFVVASTLAAQESSSPIAPGATLQLVAQDFTFTEGPAFQPSGDVYFTDQPNNRILRWNEQEGVSTWLEPAGRSNGLYFDAEGNLWACADEKNELWRIAPDKSVEVMLRVYDEKLLNGPNDLWIRPGGALYFTDPFYKREYWNRGPQEQPVQGVYFLDAEGKVRRVAEDLEQPNGLIGTPDGQTLYVSDIRAGKTWAYAIQPDGALTGKRLFCEMGSDGMTLDDAGNVYLTGKGVTVFNSDGKQTAHIEVPEPWTANVTFGGKERDHLFITASKGVYLLKMRTRGV